MKESLQKRTHRLLSSNNLQAKKKYGQNYLTDANVIERIVDTSQVDESTTVIEIGPGLGALTQKLLEKSKQVIAYEIDATLIPVLNREFSESPHFILKHQDILKTSIDEDLKALGLTKQDPIVVVANLPYYITTPILTKLLEESTMINRYTLMAQYEVARRLTADTNTKDYNALSVLMHYKTTPSFAFKVSKNVFMPPPNVDSAIITLTTKKPPKIENEAFFLDFVQRAFKQKRKTLANNISAGYNVDKARVNALLEAEGFATNIRAEGIDVKGFIKLSEAFYTTLYVTHET